MYLHTILRMYYEAVGSVELTGAAQSRSIKAAAECRFALQDDYGPAQWLNCI